MDREDNCCPECGGIGYVEGECVYPGDWDNMAEYDPIDCPVCGGTGLLTECASEEG